MSLTRIVVDGYVWLNDQHDPGLGAHLYEAMNQTAPVIGVAKNPFKATSHATKLFRGVSTRPLFVTAIGIPTDEAVAHIAAIHGTHRFPPKLKRVDRLSRDF